MQGKLEESLLKAAKVFYFQQDKINTLNIQPDI